MSDPERINGREHVAVFAKRVDDIVECLEPDMEILGDTHVFGCLPTRFRRHALATAMALESIVPQLSLPELIGIITLSMGVIIADYESR